jgi:cytidine deaminase
MTPRLGMDLSGLDARDRALTRAAAALLRRRYQHERHTVAAVVRTRSGRTYSGVNVDGIHGPCAEPVAMGAAATAGDEAFETMVAVRRVGRSYPIINPCGNCRQLLFEYAPEAAFLVAWPDGSARRLTARESLPAPSE